MGSRRQAHSKVLCGLAKRFAKLLGLPYNTHCNLLNLICDDIPVDCQLDNRLLKFMSSCSLRRSENIVVKLCYKLACNGSQSTTCNNISFLCAKYGICRSVLCKGCRCYKGLSYQSSDTCNLYEIKASVIRDMLNTRGKPFGEQLCHWIYYG